MKNLLTIALLVSATTFAYSDIPADQVTAENCIECLKTGTSKDALRAKIAELKNRNEISEEVAAACEAAIEAFTVETSEEVAAE